MTQPYTVQHLYTLIDDYDNVIPDVVTAHLRWTAGMIEAYQSTTLSGSTYANSVREDNKTLLVELRGEKQKVETLKQAHKEALATADKRISTLESRVLEVGAERNSLKQKLEEALRKVDQIRALADWAASD